MQFAAIGMYLAHKFPRSSFVAVFPTQVVSVRHLGLAIDCTVGGGLGHWPLDFFAWVRIPVVLDDFVCLAVAS